MKLEKIFTLANFKVRIPFLALERSLRNLGCDIPLFVIPYDEDIFELPQGSEWYYNADLFAWLETFNPHKTTRKYACLLERNYQFIDTDAVFLRHPSTVLENLEGFISSCCHWNNPGHTYDDHSIAILRELSTTWPKSVFNSGQFASSEILYDLDTLKKTCEKHAETCLTGHHHEQPGVNLLANLSNTPITNLTLPPHAMESTWAGDYKDRDFKAFFASIPEAKRPYLIHWAGRKMGPQNSISELFYELLSPDEMTSFQNAFSQNPPTRTIQNRIKDAAKAFLR
jgi:hypothetical protein